MKIKFFEILIQVSHVAIASLLLTIVVFSSETSLGGRGIYEVVEVSGEGYIWNHRWAKWTKITDKMNLSEGALLQMEAGFVLKVKSAHPEWDIQLLESIQFNVDQPTLARLEYKSLRQFDNMGEFISVEGHVSSKFEDKDKSSFDLATAWDFMMSSFAKKSDDVEFQGQNVSEGGAKNPDETRSPIKYGRIHIDFPKAGGTYVVDKLPSFFAIRWRAPDKNLEPYKLFIWKEGDAVGKELVTTKKLDYRLNVLNHGNYYVRIESSDGKWKSDSVKYSIFYFGSDEDNTQLDFMKKLNAPKNKIIIKKNRERKKENKERNLQTN